MLGLVGFFVCAEVRMLREGAADTRLPACTLCLSLTSQLWAAAASLQVLREAEVDMLAFLLKLLAADGGLAAAFLSCPELPALLDQAAGTPASDKKVRRRSSCGWSGERRAGVVARLQGCGAAVPALKPLPSSSTPVFLQLHSFERWLSS